MLPVAFSPLPVRVAFVSFVPSLSACPAFFDASPPPIAVNTKSFVWCTLPCFEVYVAEALVYSMPASVMVFHTYTLICSHIFTYTCTLSHKMAYI